MKSGTLVDNFASLGSGLRRYSQLIIALLRKEELNRRRAPMDSIVNLLEPVFILGTMAVLWWLLDRRTFVILGGSPALFYATGFFSIYFFIYISRRMRRIGRPLRRFPIERRLDHILVHIILRIADYTILGIVVFGGLYFFVTPDAFPYDFEPVAKACIATVMIGFGWGALNLSISRKLAFSNHVFNAFNRTLLFFSGVLFIPDFLPPGTRYLFSFNPMLHIVTLFRQGFYPHYPSMLLDTSYLAMCCIVAVTAGLILERITRRFE